MVTATEEVKIKGYGARLQQPEPPAIGTPVVFFPRPGEGAGRQDRYPAVIKNVMPDGNATIMVFYASDDIREIVVPPRDEQNPRGWEVLVQPVEQGSAFTVNDRMTALTKRIEELEKAMAEGPKAAKRAAAAQKRR